MRLHAEGTREGADGTMQEFRTAFPFFAVEARTDDPRRIDIGVWARLDQLLIRLYEAEDDLTIRLLVDTSASMEGPKALKRAAPTQR